MSEITRKDPLTAASTKVGVVLHNNNKKSLHISREKLESNLLNNRLQLHVVGKWFRRIFWRVFFFLFVGSFFSLELIQSNCHKTLVRMKLARI